MAPVVAYDGNRGDVMCRIPHCGETPRHHRLVATRRTAALQVTAALFGFNSSLLLKDATAGLAPAER
jgi:hypothetical protein